MATLIILSVKDLGAQSFGRPIFAPAVGVVLRSFADEVNRRADDNDMFKHPADFELYKIGTFDDLTGIITPLAMPELVQRAKDLTDH